MARSTCGEAAGKAHDIGDSRLLAAEGLVEELALQAAELDVVGADIGNDIHLAPAETGLVVRLDDRNAGVVDQLDAGDDAVARRRQDDEVVFLRDEVLQIGEFGCDVAAVAVDKIVGEAELLGAVLEPGLEVRIEGHLQIGDADADLLVGRLHARRLRHPLHRQAAQLIGRCRRRQERRKTKRQQTEHGRPPDDP